jgi:hypothetical protein
LLRTNEVDEPHFDRASVALGFDVEKVYFEHGF